jgi:hypothetical protein
MPNFASRHHSVLAACWAEGAAGWDAVSCAEAKTGVSRSAVKIPKIVFMGLLMLLG